MTPCTCLVQAGQIPAATEAALRSGLSNFAERAFGAPAEINWIIVPEKGGFTAAKPSTSALVTLQADAPVEQSRRVALLQELCDLWMGETNCSLDEIVAVISDPQ